MEAIRIFAEDTAEHKNLEAAAALMTMISPKQRRYSVGECWFDYGSRTAWTTILAESGLQAYTHYQALNPAKQEAILRAETGRDMLDVVEAIIEKEI